MLNRIALLTLLCPLPASAFSPIAEVVCAPRDAMVTRLKSQFGATLMSSGIRDQDAVMEVWANTAGAWTLVQRYANGQSCILAMGEDWGDMLPRGGTKG